MKYKYNDNINSEKKQLTDKNIGNQKKKERNSSFELLRIILITLIVLHHIFINTISLEYLNNNNYLKLINWNYILLKIISNYGQFGNHVFIMISGFFSITKSNFNWNKFLSILFEIYTYYYPSILLGKKLSAVYKKVKFPDYSSSKIYFPNLTQNGNWFAQIYLCLLIFIPYINMGLLSLNKEKYRQLIILIIIFYCIFKSIVDYLEMNSIIFSTTSFINLLLPYIIGGYIRIYDLKYKVLWKIIAICYFIFTIFSEIFFDILSYNYKNYNFVLFNSYLSFRINSLISIIGSMGMIYFFRSINLYNKKINWIAASVFGIYLVHGNKHITPYMYNIWFKLNLNDNYFLLKYIVKAFLIIILSLSLDIIRRYTIGLIFNKIIKIIIRTINDY
jgi:hypothetical protein